MPNKYQGLKGRKFILAMTTIAAMLLLVVISCVVVVANTDNAAVTTLIDKVIVGALTTFAGVLGVLINGIAQHRTPGDEETDKKEEDK